MVGLILTMLVVVFHSLYLFLVSILGFYYFSVTCFVCRFLFVCFLFLPFIIHRNFLLKAGHCESGNRNGGK